MMSIGATVKIIANAGLFLSSQLVSFGEGYLPKFLRSGPILEIASMINYISHALNNAGRSFMIFAEVLIRLAAVPIYLFIRIFTNIHILQAL